MKRRTLLSATACAALAACASLGAAPARVFDTKTGRALTHGELLARLRGARYVLLGELHDSALHHRLRGELIAALGARTQVVAEHLSFGKTVATDTTTPLLARLEAAGFAARNWRWPLHEPLFAPVAGAGLPLLGGNAELAVVRQVAREGEAAIPADLQALLQRAPLAAQARATLDADLLRGHCGHLSAARTPPMRAAQRTRDASMALALMQAARAGAQPAVLVAGNGHVRNDFGVPQLLRVLQPEAGTVSVGFVEGERPPPDAPYDIVWLTAATERSDPCAGFTMPARPASAPTSAPAR